LPASTAKRVILYRFDRQPLEGVVSPSAYLQPDRIELITLDGNLQILGYTEFKALCFVSEGAVFDLFGPHNLFERRPKMPGLWTRFTFRDDAVLEGVLPHNLLDWPRMGYLITPPRAGGGRQKVFIPQASLSATELRGVVGLPFPRGVRRKTAGPPDERGQLTMFE
jgi:hypothetical protein